MRRNSSNLLTKLMDKKIRVYRFAFLLIFCVILIYSNFVTNVVSDYVYYTIDEILIQQVKAIDSKIESQKNALIGLSTASESVYDDNEFMLDTMMSMVEETVFVHMFFVDLDGVGVSEEGDRVDISDREYYKDLKLGNTIVSNP